ncbi:epoxide hydrolase N-terminal domain-containing protein [Cellulomonas sp. SLBN-39]|uniref:epoxide hydrolase N-terminal domain-containing protein n=1 Tax=Cellulomonas sp. SLBN-39 TaxID=2768446 RepID=UPI001C92DA61
MHLLHVRSPEPDALALVLTHGWPSSVVELLDVVGPLADPRAHGSPEAAIDRDVLPRGPSVRRRCPTWWSRT